MPAAKSKDRKRLDEDQKAAFYELSHALGNPCLQWDGFKMTLEAALIRFAVSRLKEYPMERTWDAEARAATAGRTAAERWTMCGNDRGHGPWPEPASEVLVALWPWRAGEPSDVAMAQFFWEGANSWRPSFRGPSGDRFKNVYAWAPMPSAPPMPDDLAAAIRSRSTSEQGDR